MFDFGDTTGMTSGHPAGEVGGSATARGMEPDERRESGDADEAPGADCGAVSSVALGLAFVGRSGWVGGGACVALASSPLRQGRVVSFRRPHIGLCGGGGWRVMRRCRPRVRRSLSTVPPAVQACPWYCAVVTQC